MKLNVGAGKLCYDNYINVDIKYFSGIDIICNIDGVLLPFKDCSFDEILVDHTLNHIDNMMNLMEEIHRVGIAGAKVLISEPYYRYEGAFQDPTHKHFFAERTFEIFCENYEYNYYTKARFEVVSVKLSITHKTKTKSLAKKIMKIPIPFRRILNNFLWNLYSEIHYELKVLK